LHSRKYLGNFEGMLSKLINIDPEILGGTPVFNGTRVPVKNLFDYLETEKLLKPFYRILKLSPVNKC